MPSKFRFWFALCFIKANRKRPSRNKLGLRQGTALNFIDQCISFSSLFKLFIHVIGLFKREQWSGEQRDGQNRRQWLTRKQWLARPHRPLRLYSVSQRFFCNKSKISSNFLFVFFFISNQKLPADLTDLELKVKWLIWRFICEVLPLFLSNFHCFFLF